MIPSTPYRIPKLPHALVTVSHRKYTLEVSVPSCVVCSSPERTHLRGLTWATCYHAGSWAPLLPIKPEILRPGPSLCKKFPGSFCASPLFLLHKPWAWEFLSSGGESREKKSIYLCAWGSPVIELDQKSIHKRPQIQDRHCKRTISTCLWASKAGT